MATVDRCLYTSRFRRCGPGTLQGRWSVPAAEAKQPTERSSEALVIKVKPRGNESIQQMLKRFKRLCQREGLVRDIKRHSYYEKPSERKRRQTRKAARKVTRTDSPRRG
jgi:small subunit ribosomal protein S21